MTKRRIARKGQTKAGPKRIRTNVKSYSFLPSIWGMWHHDVISNSPGQPLPYGLGVLGSHGLSPVLAPLIAYSFPQQIFHIPQSSNILEPPFQLRLPCHGFMPCPLRGCLQGSWPCHTLPDIQACLWNVGGSPHGPYVLHSACLQNSTSHGWYQGLPPVGVVTGPPLHIIGTQ